MINKQTNKQMIKEDLKFGCFYTTPPPLRLKFKLE